uniref:Uncharacterized protein n=1 Tax=Anguilla anguilla TaxID=7936 RepID=A0A0E9RBX6_ANGAN
MYSVNFPQDIAFDAFVSLGSTVVISCPPSPHSRINKKGIGDRKNKVKK